MAVYERSVHVAAPFEDVWDFHSRISGLEALTPNWMNLRLESVVGPDGEADPGVLEAGSRAESSVRPFNVGPRQRWTSVITEREEGDGTAMFRDEMEGGPFSAWEHTHRFHQESEGTLVQDHVEYELPPGGLGRALSPLAVVGLEPMFRFRHRKTRELLE